MPLDNTCRGCGSGLGRERSWNVPRRLILQGAESSVPPLARSLGLYTSLKFCSFDAIQPVQLHRAPTLRRNPCLGFNYMLPWHLSLVTFLIFEQGSLSFHFSLGPTNSCPWPWIIPGDWPRPWQPPVTDSRSQEVAHLGAVSHPYSRELEYSRPPSPRWDRGGTRLYPLQTAPGMGQFYIYVIMVHICPFFTCFVPNITSKIFSVKLHCLQCYWNICKVSRVDVFYLMISLPSSVTIPVSISLFYCVSFSSSSPQVFCGNMEYKETYICTYYWSGFQIISI